MKIEVTGGKKNIRLTLPTKLLFSKTVIKLVMKNSHRISRLSDLPKDALEAVMEELQQIKQEKGEWLLFESESADGETIHITL